MVNDNANVGPVGVANDDRVVISAMVTISVMDHQRAVMDNHAAPLLAHDDRLSLSRGGHRGYKYRSGYKCKSFLQNVHVNSLPAKAGYGCVTEGSCLVFRRPSKITCLRVW